MTELKRVLGFRDLVIFYIVAIFGVRMLPIAASAGPSIVIYFIISLVIFFIPMGLTVTDLGKRYPEEGGIYIWSKNAFGDFHGYITAWTYWTSNLAYFPSLLFFASAQALLIIPAFKGYSGNGLVHSAISIAAIMLILILNIKGLKKSSVLNKISVSATYVVVAVIIAVGFISLIKFGSATDMSFSNWVPGISNIKDFVFLSTVVYMFAGLESASMLGGEVKNASRTIPRAIVISGIIISCMYFLSAFSLLLSFPSDNLSSLTGMPDAVSTGIGNIAGQQLTGLSASIVSLLLVLMIIGQMSVWLTATARLPFVVGLDRYLPAAFGKLHPKFGTPYISLITLASVTIFFVILSGLGEKAKQVYDILVSLEIVSSLIPYLYIFASVVKFEIDKKYRGKINLPGGQKNAMAAGIVGFLVVGISLFLALIPGEDVKDTFTFYSTVLISLALNMSVGIGLYIYAKKKSKRKLLKEEIVKL
ncbi:MAG: APC family permease [Ignavibacteriaceae bacterium]